MSCPAHIDRRVVTMFGATHARLQDIRRETRIPMKFLMDDAVNALAEKVAKSRLLKTD